ncbi:MAG TPA: thiamine-phosphate kinase [Polyangiaceae bacterium]|nr:thiamine-phosphate kinase [Polyangiaceae bacterium]
MAITERRALAILKQQLAASGATPRWLALGIGDDCAILRGPLQSAVWTTDACAEGSHFLWEWMAPEDIAHKAWHAALSDVAAMGGAPRGVNVHLTLTERVGDAFLRRFAAEQARLVQSTRAVVTGGNITFGSHFSVVTSVLGDVRGAALRRGTARAGDELWLCGEVGLARAGLLLLQRGQRGRPSPAEQHCLQAFRRPVAQLKRGPQLLGRARACLDVSDGLARDVQNLAKASGVHIAVDREELRRTLHADLVQVADELGEDPLDLAWTGGEDYALLSTGPAAKRPKWVNVIGQVHKRAR